MRAFLEQLAKQDPPLDIGLYDTNKHHQFQEIPAVDQTAIEEVQVVKTKKDKKQSKKVVDEEPQKVVNNESVDSEQ